MNPEFPIPVPDRLPLLIQPCPIVEAVVEIRFVTTESWRTMPGLLYANIRDRYPEQQDLPLAQLPEPIRREQVQLTHAPLTRFLGADFMIQFGPRVISLVTKPNQYPGWKAIEREMEWLLNQIQKSGFVRESERLGLRYIDFFAFDIFPQLILGVQVGNRQLAGGEISVSTVLPRAPFMTRLQITNSGLLSVGNEVKRGSVVDVDTWLGALDFDLAGNAMDALGRAHVMTKEVFFGLLQPAFLATLQPQYS
jgi:uncharacterized protein (TIGR04255 family)